MKVAYLLNRYGTLFGQTIVGINASGLFAGAWQHVSLCTLGWHCSPNFGCRFAGFIGIYLLFSLESAHSKSTAP